MDNRQKKTDRVARMSFFWNAVYSGSSAIQSFIILFAVAQKKELSEAGIVTIGFTIGILAMIVGIYGVRNFQVTDTTEKYSFSDYYWLRVITVVLSLVLIMLYISAMIMMGRYSTYKSLVVLEIVILKLVDAFESVYVGRLQQKGRLDVGARIAAIRTISSTIIVFLMVWIGRDTAVAFCTGIVLSVIIDVALLWNARKYTGFAIETIDRKPVTDLLIVTLPLCLGTALHNYIGNGPKYLVDYYMNDDIQAISGYIMMPMFVITVLNAFLMQPTVKSLGDAWYSRDRVRLVGLMRKHLTIISAATVIVLIAGIYIALPVLSIVYKVDLSLFKTEFIIIMIGGTIYTFSAYGMLLLTVIRQQRWIVAGCALSIMVYLICGRVIVDNGGLKGVSWLYVAANTVMLCTFAIGLMRGYFSFETAERTQGSEKSVN